MPLNILTSGYPQEVSALMLSLRDFLLQKFPNLVEEIDLTSRILAYRVGPGIKGISFTIIPSQKGVKLGIPYGSQLADPDKLLEGSGKLHKVVLITSAGQLNTQALSDLICASYQSALARSRKDNSTDV